MAFRRQTSGASVWGTRHEARAKRGEPETRNAQAGTSDASMKQRKGPRTQARGWPGVVARVMRPHFPPLSPGGAAPRLSSLHLHLSDVICSVAVPSETPPRSPPLSPVVCQGKINAFNACTLDSQPAPMPSSPRVFLVRHGETEWSLSGQHTGRTDIALTASGEKRVRATGEALVGNDRLIVPRRLSHMSAASQATHSYVSPRKRAQRTFELLGLDTGALPWAAHGTAHARLGPACDARVEVTEYVREWDYGDYEGITSPEIRRMRTDQGYQGTWDIWRDGCPGGESPEHVTERLGRLIAEIRQKWHQPVMSSTDAAGGAGDVLIVAHGHILRALAMRWAGKTLQDGPAFLLEAGGVGTLSYEHHSIEEPAILFGGAFVVDMAEKGMRA
ncbi:phosphoglycerate mutase family protein [Ophiocordyceps sinensis CO18]|uniref:Phosphoglycerate mutase family protein n=1 Tax=Ophiocordyceps sinensis (strain Co18 / CGMCC 3.14243) TaxID=911162 RepID=T5AB21_OPHSC|nr:phosphoglycerate mutase family protein [Ophiocordyceps sinensis CO18]